MERLLLLQLILVTSTGIALSQQIQIPVIPFDEKAPHVSYKVHNRCKRFKSYWKCVDRSDRKVTSSLDMDY